MGVLLACRESSIRVCSGPNPSLLVHADKADHLGTCGIVVDRSRETPAKHVKRDSSVKKLCEQPWSWDLRSPVWATPLQFKEAVHLCDMRGVLDL